MKDEKNTNAAAEAAEAKERKREVLTRFTASELDAMKRDTGADADATAVAAYARKRLAAEGANA